MLFGFLLLLLIYAFTSYLFYRRSMEIAPIWMPHGSFSAGTSFRTKLVFIVWIIPVAVGIYLANTPTQTDVGNAILSLASLILITGLIYGLMQRASENPSTAASNSTVGAPSAPLSEPTTQLVESKRNGLPPLDARVISPGLHFTNLQAAPEDIVHHVPRGIADRILSELDAARKKSEQIVAANTVLSSEGQQMKEQIATLEKNFHDAEQALNELSRINQTLRSKSSTNEKPFAQMTVEEIDKARETREREIRTLDEMKRAKLQAQRTG